MSPRPPWDLHMNGRYYQFYVEGACVMTSPSTDKPGTPGLPRWVMIYVLILVAVFVWGPLIQLHGYRSWPILIFYIAGGLGFLGGMIAHRTGGGASAAGHPGH